MKIAGLTNSLLTLSIASLAFTGCDRVNIQNKPSMQSQGPNAGVYAKVVLEHGPEPRDYAAAYSLHRDRLETCEQSRTAALGIAFNPLNVPSFEMLARYFDKRTVEYFEPNRYARYTYRYFVSTRERTVPQVNFCFAIPSSSYELATIEIRTACKVIDIQMPAPDGSMQGSLQESELDAASCADEKLSNANRAEKDRNDAINSPLVEKVLEHECVYSPAISLGGTVVMSQGETCRLKLMPFHATSGRDVILRIRKDGLAGNIVDSMVIPTGKFDRSIVNVRASEVNLTQNLKDDVFEVPAIAKDFKPPQ